MIGRRVPVATVETLRGPRGVLQGTVGWRSLRLHRFRIRAVHHRLWELGREAPERTLGGFELRRGDRFAYAYDTIDVRRHEDRVEGRHEAPPGERHPERVGGRGACPPAGCGGPAGRDERRAEALGIDAREDIDTMVDLLDRITAERQPHLLDDEKVRWRLEGALDPSPRPPPASPAPRSGVATRA